MRKRRLSRLLHAWPIAALGLLGYALFDDLGLMAGVLLGAIMSLAIKDHGTKPDYLTVPLTISIANTVAVTCTLTLLVHPFLVPSNPVHLAAKMEAIEPVTKILALLIPAIDYLPERLSQIGQNEWAVGARYVLVIGWFNLAAAATGFYVATIAHVRSKWADGVFGFTKSQRLAFLGLGAAFIAFSSIWIFFGTVGESGLTSRRGPDGLPMLGIFFFMTAIGLLFVFLACGDWWNSRRSRHKNR